MRKKLLFRSLSLAFLATLSLSSPKLFACAGPAVQWNNDLNIVASVTDQNINVVGTNALAAPIVVQALTCDITISVVTGDAVITGSATTGVAPTLFLFADAGRTITFDLQDSLLFSGTALGATPLALMITVSGEGQVIFDIDGGESVTFGKTEPLVGGTFFFAGLANPVPADAAVVFQTNNAAPTLISQVIVGEGSLISFLGQPGIGPVNGSINFLSLPPIAPGLPPD